MKPLYQTKPLPNAGWAVLPTFLISLFVGVPLWLGLFLPVTIVFLILKKCGLVKGEKKQQRAEADFASLTGQKTESQREFDIVLYGATGYTGKLAAKYLAKTYGTTVKWAIAGRRKQALEDIRFDLLKSYPNLELPILIGDSSDPDSLMPIISNTRVFMTTVGPYDLYGTPIVALCSHFGTHYCDITGETNWAREMIERADDLARASGAKIVHFCGNDCVPWDLAALAMANFLKKQHGQELKSIRFYNEMSASPSGGTLATVKNSIHTLGAAVKSALGYDPLLKTLSGTKSDSATINSNPKYLFYSDEYQAWVGPWVMAEVNYNCVKRSNALLGYGKKVDYAEHFVFPGVMAGLVNLFGLVVFGTALFCPPLMWVMNKFLPQPGSGPSEASLAKGFLKITGYGTGDRGAQIICEMYFPNDTGYVDTARMLVESAMVLKDEPTDGRGGDLTPAPAMQEKLLERLIKTGTNWRIRDVNPKDK